MSDRILLIFFVVWTLSSAAAAGIAMIHIWHTSRMQPDHAAHRRRLTLRAAEIVVAHIAAIAIAAVILVGGYIHG